MSDNLENKNTAVAPSEEKQQYSLNDDRRALLFPFVSDLLGASGSRKSDLFRALLRLQDLLHDLLDHTVTSSRPFPQ